MSFPSLAPFDEHNRQLEASVHPPNWRNPKPAGRYNLVVIGGGTAGLVAAAGAAGLGAKVALIERALLGGDCLNVGCVPSKAVISAARRAAAVRNAGAYGVQVPKDVRVAFGDVMERMRHIRAGIAPHDSAQRFTGLGIDVYLGHASFIDSETVEVDGERLKFKKAVIAAGARAATPPIPGIEDVDYLTNETVFSLAERPCRFGVIGAGPIGCEMAQSFARLGSRVYLAETMHGVLPREDRDAAEFVARSLQADGVTLFCCAKDLTLKKGDAGGVRMTVDSHGEYHDETVDRLLVAVGRAPNVEGLGLEAVGVEYNQKGVVVNDKLQTSNPRIYAAGDICSPYPFTHAADFMARIVIQNALFLPTARFSALTIPWATYTEPEIAHVGVYEREARAKGLAIDTYTQPLAEVDRAVLDGETAGFVRVHVERGKDKILGATIVAAHAGDMISEISLAMTHGLGLKAIASTIYPYPTQAEAIRKVGDQYNRTRLTPRVRTMMTKWMKWRR